MPHSSDFTSFIHILNFAVDIGIDLHHLIIDPEATIYLQ